MSKVLIYINLIAILLLLFAGFDKVLGYKFLTDNGQGLVIFTASIFLLVTTFLQITMKKHDDK